MTNADRIRNMDNEELLDFLCSIRTYDEGAVKTIENGVAMCSVSDVEEWLNSEVICGEVEKGKKRMRLIDADALLEELNSFSMRITGSVDALVLSAIYETKKSIAKMIDEQPTAYDVDKIVARIAERLEEEGCQHFEGSVSVDLQVAIEIIKAEMNG